MNPLGVVSGKWGRCVYGTGVSVVGGVRVGGGHKRVKFPGHFLW